MKNRLSLQEIRSNIDRFASLSDRSLSHVLGKELYSEFRDWFVHAEDRCAAIYHIYDIENDRWQQKTVIINSTATYPDVEDIGYMFISLIEINTFLETKKAKLILQSFKYDGD